VTAWRLVADVGGTNVRFARTQNGNRLSEPRCYLVSAFPSFMSALQVYLGETGGLLGCESAAIGAAGPVDADAVRLTNADWVIRRAEVSAAIGAPCGLVNDVQAVACGVPYLSNGDLLMLGEAAPDLGRAQRLLTANVGTGFGAATLVNSSAGWLCCPSEAGHMTLTCRELDGPLRDEFTSVEHLLSGPGLCHLHHLLSNGPAMTNPASIFCQTSSDAHCAAVLEVFTRVFGEVLGNLALAVAAWDGVFLCGSVARAFSETADLSIFRRAFERKGPMTGLMKRIPIAVILKGDAALVGLANLPL